MARTPLYDTHAALGATFTPFAGFEMPVHYGSIKDEHAAVRSSVGLFDVSHMSNLRVTGPGAAAMIGAVTPKPMHDLADGQGRYSVFLREDGTILDDVFVFRLDAEALFVVPNAGMNEATAAHLRATNTPDARVVDASDQWAILALQGPDARSVLEAASPDPAPKFHRICTMHIGGVECLVSGTGYTGEKGVEVYVQADGAVSVWSALVAAGDANGTPVRPIGLGARDTLRLEKGYALAGNEFAGGRTPLEAGLDWLIDWDHAFQGKDALLAQQETGDYDRLVGLTMRKGIPRSGYAVQRDGATIGTITSGTLSPTLGTGIALAYCKQVEVGDAVDVDIRGRPKPALAAAPPFV